MYDDGSFGTVTLQDSFTVTLSSSARQYSVSPAQVTVVATATFSFELESGGVYGPAIVPTSVVVDTFTISQPSSPPAPISESSLAALLPEQAALRYSHSSASWQMCFDTDFIANAAAIPLTNAPAFEDVAQYGTHQDSAFVRHSRSYTLSTVSTDLSQSWAAGFVYGSASSGAITAPASPICTDLEIGGGSGEPWEPVWTPPSHKYEPPDLPAVPDAPDLGEAPEMLIDDSDPEDLTFAPYQDPLETALIRFRTRLGIPTTAAILNTGVANNPGVRTWNFDVYGTTYTFTLDFNQWSNELLLFKLVFNGIVVGWVIGMIYDAIRST